MQSDDVLRDLRRAVDVRPDPDTAQERTRTRRPTRYRDAYDTADVYGDGRSEQLIGGFLREHPDAGVLVATKMGRRVALDPALYTVDNFRAWTDRSRRNLGVDRLDLVQLHCPPTPVYSSEAVFEALDT